MTDRPAWQAMVLGPDGEPVGAGVLVDERHMLTCAHVVNDALGHAKTADEQPAEPVMVDFLVSETDPMPARVLPGGWEPIRPNERGDVAVLELVSAAPWGTQPARLRRPSRLLGHRFDVVGFPRGYRAGVSAHGEIRRPGGPGGQGVELQVTELTGHAVERGFSGAPVYDHDVDAVVGIVVAADKLATARLAWMLPVDVLAGYWPPLDGLVRSWALYGAGDLEGHWSPQARGVERDFVPGWYFTGRVQVLRELVAWLKEPRADGGVRVVTGGPGSGKSAVLARLVTTADPRYRTRMPDLDPAEVPVAPIGVVDVAVWARGKSLQEIVQAIAQATELSLPTVSPTEADWKLPDLLLNAVGHRGKPCTIVVDALDEARDSDIIASRLLRPLAVEAASLGIRILVATRRGRDEELVARLGASAVQFDLDRPPYLERADLVAYVSRRLLRDAEPDASTPYRGKKELTKLVADAVATRAYPTFLVAQLHSRTLVEADTVVDIHAPGWQARFPSSVADAMRDYLDAFEEDRRRVQDLFLPLAYAEGDGLPCDELWPALATALAGRRYTLEDVQWLLDTAADYLVERIESGGQAVYRLYHQALVDYLRPPQRELSRQQRVVDALLGLVPLLPQPLERDWSAAHPYIRSHLATHAATVGRLDELLTDPRFLLSADCDRLLRTLPAARRPDAVQAARAYQRAVRLIRDHPPGEAAAYLQLHARQLGCSQLADRLQHAELRQPWRVPWLRWRPVRFRQIIGRHDGSAVDAVTVGKADGQMVVVSGGSDGAVRVWKLASGEPISRPFRGHEGNVNAVAVAELDGRAIVVSGSGDRTLRVWDLASEQPIGQPLRGHDNTVMAVVVAELDGRPVVVSGSGDGTVRRWDLGSRQPIGQPLRGHEKAVTAVAVAKLDGRAVVVSGSGDGTVRRWDLRSGEPIEEPLCGYDSNVLAPWVRALAVGELDGRQVVVSGGDDRMVRVWDLRSGQSIGQPLRGHDDGINAVAVAEVDGRPVVVSGSGDGTVRLWKLASGEPIDEPLRGHEKAVTALAVGELDGRPVVVSGSGDSTVRVWELRIGEPISQPLPGHDDAVTALAVGELDGRQVVVSGSYDGTVRAWELAGGEPISPLLRGHDWVMAVAIAELDGRPVVVSGSRDGTVRVWDLVSGEPVGQPLRGEAVTAMALGELDGSLVVAAAARATLRVCDLTTWGHSESGSPSSYNPNPIWAVAPFKLNGRPALATGGNDGTVRVWDLESGKPVGQPFDHGSWVYTVTVGTLDGRQVVVSGSGRTVRVWEPISGAELYRLKGHTNTVNAVAAGTLNGRAVVASGGADQTVRVWELTSGVPSGFQVEVGSAVTEIAVTAGTLVVGTKMGLLVLDLSA